MKRSDEPSGPAGSLQNAWKPGSSPNGLWHDGIGRKRTKVLQAGRGNKKPEPVKIRVFNLAATYSRGGYTTTTIGKAAFDGRVRNGIGSVHSFMTTKKSLQTATVGLDSSAYFKEQDVL